MDPQTPVHRPWTLMVYMAGDNGKIFDTQAGRIKLMAPMEEAGYQDLFEMGTVGTTDQCAVTCLFDTLDASYLVEVRKGTAFQRQPGAAATRGEHRRPRDAEGVHHSKCAELPGRPLRPGDLEPRHGLAGCGSLRHGARAGRRAPHQQRDLPHDLQADHRGRDDAAYRVRRLKQGFSGYGGSAPGVFSGRGSDRSPAGYHRHGRLPDGDDRGRARTDPLC